VNSAYTNIAAIIDAPNQAAAAANSAAQAAASAASGMYSAVQDKSANYTIVAADAGDLIRVSTGSGAVTITLPAISAVGDGFKIAVVKWTSDANAVNIVRSGSDTINGATSAQIGSQYSQIILVADGETSTWFASQSGLGATNVNIDNFSGNGSTTAFTLTSDPSTENNTSVFISGVYQQKNTYSVSGTTLTFSTAPPSGTGNIEVAYATPLAIGTPSDGTVTTAKIVDGNVTAAKLASGAAVSSIGYTPVNKAGDSMSGSLLVGGGTQTYGYGGGYVAGFKTTGSQTYISIAQGTQALDSQGMIIGLDGGAIRYSGRDDKPVIFSSNDVSRFQIPASTGDFQATIGGAGTLYPAYFCRAWVSFNGTGTVAIKNSKNVSSITDNSTGQYTVNFTTAMPDANYAFHVNGKYTSWYTCFFGSGSYGGITASQLSVGVSDAYGNSQWQDTDTVTVSIFR
jgi:hypothetical protein